VFNQLSYSKVSTEQPKALQKLISELRKLTATHNFLIKGSGQSFLIKILSLGVGFALQVLLARILKVEQFGIYMYVLAWINILTLIGKLGLDQAAKKFLPSFKNKSLKLSAYIRYSSNIVFLFSLLLGAIVILATYQVKDQIGQKLFSVFVGGAALLVVNTHLQLIGSFLEALKKIISGQLPRSIIRPLLICVGLGFFAYFNITTALAAMVLNIISTLVALIIIGYYLFKYVPIQFSNYQKESLWIKTAFPLLLSSGIHLLLTQTDIILLGYFKNTDLAGIYSSVSRISQLVLFGLTAVNIITAPLISELYNKNKLKKLQEMVSLSAVLTLILTFPVILILAIITPSILNIFGAEFITGTMALRIILIGQFINAFSGSISFLMTMTNYHKESLFILSFATIINLILNIILIPKFGLEGAAITTAITTTFWNLTMYFYIKKKLKIDSTIFGFVRK
jgi:O-antigen/teichoic acid export membrane protein